MLRALDSARLCAARLSPNKPSYILLKWASSEAAKLDAVSAEDIRQPDYTPRINNEIDTDISAAKDKTCLLTNVSKVRFNSKNAVNLINVLGGWAAAGKFSTAEYEKLAERERIESILKKGELAAGIPTLLQTVRSLTVLGCDPSSEIVDSLENEILWQLRKSSLSLNFLVVAFHADNQQTSLQQEVFRNAVGNIKRRWIELEDAKDFIGFINHSRHFDNKFIETIEDRLVEFVDKFSSDNQAKIMVALSANRRRPTPLLRSLSFHLIRNKEPLAFRLACDTLYAINRLSFHDQLLVEHLCNDLAPQVSRAGTASTVAALCTSLGQLKYRHEALLDAVSDWVTQHFDNCRDHTVTSLILCLAAVDYTPANWEELLDKIVRMTSRPMSCNETIWLDVVWSLAVLKHWQPSLMRSVLNDTFVQKILAMSAANEKVIKSKLNQLWAISQAESIGIPDLQVKMPLPRERNPSRNTSALTRSVLNALANFVPPQKYLREDSVTSWGIEIEGECIFNGSVIPQSLIDHSLAGPLPPPLFRVAVLVLDYRDCCLGSTHPTGAQVLRKRLLTASGYKVVQVPYTDFNPKADLLGKVRLLERLIRNELSCPQS